MWNNVVSKCSQLRKTCFTDPLEAEGMSWFSNFCLNMRYAAGTAPGVLRLLAHAVVPGVCQDACRSFHYGYGTAGDTTKTD